MHTSLPRTSGRRDPVVGPGADLLDHVHAVIGGTNFFAGKTPANALTSAETTCDKELDHSIYWVSQLYHITPDNEYEMVEFKGPAVYYQNRACDTSLDARPARATGPTSHALSPEGLQMVAGDPMKRTFDQSDIEQRAVNHLCFLRGGGSVQPNSLPLEQCIETRSQVTFPSCWNGKDLDSPDHKSHRRSSRVAPDRGHHHLLRVLLQHVELQRPQLRLRAGDKTGYGFHGDFVNGWKDLQRLGDARRTCTGREGVDAPGRSLNVGANGTPGTATPRSPEKPGPAEEIGLNGAVLAQLPGGKIPLRRDAGAGQAEPRHGRGVLITLFAGDGLLGMEEGVVSELCWIEIRLLHIYKAATA
ncbi:hypothetical protein DL767_001817 [Monosporascus sp. MG133]|nr:hypothetical protein DL767_001817 [Monosporascus sp. MG133]